MITISCVCSVPKYVFVQSINNMGTFSFLFTCLSVMAFVFFLISDPRGMLVLRQGLVEGDIVDVRAVIQEQLYYLRSESTSSVVFCFGSNGGPPRNSVSKAAVVKMASCAVAAASTADDEVSTASGGASSAASSPGTPVAKAKAKAAVGRPRGGKKPEIDIDIQVQEANKRVGCRV